MRTHVTRACEGMGSDRAMGVVRSLPIMAEYTPIHTAHRRSQGFNTMRRVLLMLCVCTTPQP